MGTNLKCGEAEWDVGGEMKDGGGGNCDYDYWWSYEGEGGTPWEHRLEACATLGGRAVSVIKIGI
jgi:hypothetical protein